MDEFPDVLNVYDQDRVSELAAWNVCHHACGRNSPAFPSFMRDREVVSRLVVSGRSLIVVFVAAAAMEVDILIFGI